MAKVPKAGGHLKKKKEIKIEMTPVYIPHNEFLEKKAEVQNILAKMLISSHKRGRPNKNDEEDLEYAA